MNKYRTVQAQGYHFNPQKPTAYVPFKEKRAGYDEQLGTGNLYMSNGDLYQTLRAFMTSSILTPGRRQPCIHQERRGQRICQEFIRSGKRFRNYLDNSMPDITFMERNLGLIRSVIFRKRGRCGDFYIKRCELWSE